MCLVVDTGSLTILRAHRTVLTLVSIEAYLQPREACQEGKRRTHRTDGVAIGAAASPSQDEEHHQRDSCNDEHRQRAHPDVDTVEGITVRPFCQGGQQVIAHLPQWLEDHCGDAAKGTVGCQQLEQRAYMGNAGNHKHHQHGIAQPAHFPGIVVLVLFPAEPRQDVLKYTQWTDHRAIDTPEDERQHNEHHDDHHVEGHHCRQKLNLAEPAEPRVECPREVEEKQCYQDEEHRCKCGSDFT